MSPVLSIFRRELRSYFATPLAAVFIVIFLLLTGAATWYLGGFFDAGQADLQSFFRFHPWLYLLLVPAVANGAEAQAPPVDEAHHRSDGGPAALALLVQNI